MGFEDGRVVGSSDQRQQDSPIAIRHISSYHVLLHLMLALSGHVLSERTLEKTQISLLNAACIRHQWPLPNALAGTSTRTPIGERSCTCEWSPPLDGPSVTDARCVRLFVQELAVPNLFGRQSVGGEFLPTDKTCSTVDALPGSCHATP